MLNETTPEKEFIVAIKINESEYPRLQRLISGEIILHATAKKSNVETIKNCIGSELAIPSEIIPCMRCSLFYVQCSSGEDCKHTSIFANPYKMGESKFEPMGKSKSDGES